MRNWWLFIFFSVGMSCYVYAQDNNLRVVSTGGSVTEWIVALGAEKDLVGVDTTSLYPERIRALPKVGYQRQLSAEGVASLKPNLVIGTPEMGPDTALKQLNELGVRVEVLSNKADFETLATNLKKLGQLLHKEKEAEALYLSYRSQFDQVNKMTEQRRGQNSPPRVVLVMAMQGSLLAAGKGTTADWLIDQAGGENAVLFDGYQSISSESLLALKPEVILVADRSGRLDSAAIDKMVKADPVLSLTQAAAQNKVVALDATLLVAGLGPRLSDEVARLASLFYQRPDKAVLY